MPVLSRPLLDVTRNSWKISRAARGKFIVDAEEYYADLYDALKSARRNVYILGWDIASHVKLIRRDRHSEIDSDPPYLGPFLNTILKRNANLNVYMLIWDYSTFFSLDRERLTDLKLGIISHPRLHFCRDAEHPWGASHHQKIVVIDEQIAYCGGLDLTLERWDTSRHDPSDSRRPDGDEKPYRPFHDVQVRVEGEIAGPLSELFRERWRRATGKTIRPLEFAPADWPAPSRVDFEDIPVAISRTEPAYRDYPKVKEVARLTTDLILAAERSIYIENQYLTSTLVESALSESLRRPNGPEVTVVVPARPTGWFEQRTLWAARNAIVRRLIKNDVYDRFKIYVPVLPRNDTSLKLHSKVMLIDDRYARIGSANLSNRSMGLDTECDLVLDGSEKRDHQRAIRRFRARLLGEHLELSTDTVFDRINNGESMAQLIASRLKNPRHLRPLRITRHKEPPYIKEIDIADLDRPVAAERVLDELVYESGDHGRAFFRRPSFVMGCVIGILVLAAAVWYSTPLGHYLDVDFFRNFFIRYRLDSSAPIWILGTYVVSGLLFVPLNLLIVATATLYPAPKALLYIVTGGLLNAAVGYLVGRSFGAGLIIRLFTTKAKEVSKKLQRSGILPIFLVRMFPIAPYSAINFICGAIRVPFLPYLAGTLLGILPGALTLTLFQRSLIHMVRDSSPQTITIFILVFCVSVAIIYSLKRRFGSNGH